MQETSENLELKLAEEFVLNTHKHVFLTGRAGTGKTTLLKNIIKKTSKQIAVVAPTGVAAINAGGMTIHSMFQLPTKSFIPNNDPVFDEQFMNRSTLVSVQKMRAERRRVLTELDLLIIDEISMVRCDLLDAIDFTLRRIRKSSEVFGGVQLFVIGDLHQLSPVVKDYEWSTLQRFYDSPFFFSSVAWSYAKAITIELEKIYRQTDEKFVGILNNIRNGVKNEEDLEILNAQFTQKTEASDTITLTTHNRKADTINQSELGRLKTKAIKLKAEVSGTFNQSSFPTPEEIVLKKGAQVMFLRNQSEGLYYNGKIGKVIKKTSEGLQVQCEGDTFPIMVEPIEWKNTKYKLDESTNTIEPEEIGSFKQYPLKLAWAVTVHKSQGLTFDKVIVDLENTFAAGQLYVALSRCRSLEGLTLSSKISGKNIIVDRRVVEFTESSSIPENYEEILAQAKHEFEDRELKRQFDFASLLDHLEALDEYISEKPLPKKSIALILSREILNKMKVIQKTGNSFQKQLDGFYLQENGIKTVELIVDRCQKGIGYFTNELHDKIILDLDQHRKMMMVKAKTKGYIKEINSVLKHIWRVIDELYDLSYRDIKIYQSETRLKRTFVAEASQSEGSKGAKSSSKGESQRITLEMWEDKMTIEEIANERELKASTIKSHLSKWIKEGRLDISEFIDIEFAKEILKYIQENDDKSMSEVRELIPFEIDFDELRMVRNWGDYLASEGK